MTYSLQPLACDPAKLNGLSARLITSHYENNYGGAVRRLNALRVEFALLDWSKASTTSGVASSAHSESNSCASSALRSTER